MEQVKKFGVRKFIRIVWFSLAGLFLVWNWTTFQSRGLPGETFLSNDMVTVIEKSDQLIFQSNHSTGSLEVIFFQGGLCDPKAYAPLCRKLAENGFTCHILKMAYRLPQKDYLKITRLFDLKSGFYVIGGHSQGGKMAAQFVYEHPGLLKGLFLMGTSHPRDIDLSSLTIPSLKLYAEKDGLASVEEVLENKEKLPVNAKMVLLKGANHSQFGYLGKLFMDHSASITLEEQQQNTFENMLDFLNELKRTNN